MGIVCSLDSIHYPLDLVEGHHVVPSVVEAGRACGFVAGHLLGDFKFPAILQIYGDPSRPETVAGNFCRDAGSLRPPLDHGVDILLRKSCTPIELAMPEGREEGSGRLRPQA